jgi:hypothetical protein
VGVRKRFVFSYSKEDVRFGGEDSVPGFRVDAVSARSLVGGNDRALGPFTCVILYSDLTVIAVLRRCEARTKAQNRVAQIGDAGAHALTKGMTSGPRWARSVVSATRMPTFVSRVALYCISLGKSLGISFVHRIASHRVASRRTHFRPRSLC